VINLIYLKNGSKCLFFLNHLIIFSFVIFHSFSTSKIPNCNQFGITSVPFWFGYYFRKYETVLCGENVSSSKKTKKAPLIRCRYMIRFKVCSVCIVLWDPSYPLNVTRFSLHGEKREPTAASALSTGRHWWHCYTLVYIRCLYTLWCALLKFIKP